MTDNMPLEGSQDAGAPPVPGPPSPAPTGARRLLQGTAWQALAQFAPLVINLVLTPFIISGLGKEVYGVFLVAVAVQVFIAALDGGLSGSAARYFSILAGQGDRAGMTRLLTTLLGLATFTSTVIVVVVFLFAPTIMGWFPATVVDPAGAAFLLRSMAVIIAISQLRAAFQQVVWAHGTFIWNSLAIMVGHVIYVVGMVCTIHYHWGLHGIAWTQLAQQVAPTVLVIPTALKYLDRHHVRFTDRATTVDFLRYAWKVQLSSVMDVIGSQGDIMLVGRFAAPQTTPFGAGSNFAQTLGNVPMNAQVPIQTAIGHHIASLEPAEAGEKVSGLQRVWVRAVFGWVMVGAPAAYFGVNDWLHLGSSLTGRVACLVLLSFGMFLLAQVQLLWANGLGHSEVPLAYGLTSTVVNLGLTVALIGPYGAMGSVSATAVGRLVSAVVLAVLMGRRVPVGITPPWRQVPYLAGIAAAVVSGAGAWLVSHLLVGHLVPYGPLALFTCGLAAAPGLVVYLVTAFGVAGTKELLGRVRRRG